jgi:L-amino acid N-acyltransferase YncA
MAGSDLLQLKDGRAVRLRLATRKDVPAIVRLYTELSPESARTRFNGVCSPGMLSRFAQVGGPSGAVCLVAFVPGDRGALVGETRFVPAGAGLAELALTVLDRYQGSGLGRLLLRKLVERAREAGFIRLSASVNLTNAPMLHLLEPYGLVLAEPTESATASLEISTTGGMPGWPEDADAGPGKRVLIEQRSWFDGDVAAAMRGDGNVVRVCLGPRSASGRPCPLLTTGGCRLAEQADLIVALLPAQDRDCAQVLGAHRRLWNSRLAPDTALSTADGSEDQRP